jgi:lysophospholipase L1-like esterase
MNRRSFSLSLATLLVAFVGSQAMRGRVVAAETPAKVEALVQMYFVGVATVDVTPKHPVRLTGYGNRKTEFESVEQHLFAKALAIRTGGDGAPPAQVLITVDSLGVTDAITTAVAARLAEKYKLPRENVAISASHTHSAPALSGAATLLFQTPLTDAEKKHIDDYTAELTKNLGDVAEKALGDMRLATIQHGVGTAKFAVNRRALKDGKWSGFGVVPTGAVDHALPVLFVNEHVGANFWKLRAVLINYACHCTTLGGAFNKIHGDWAGCAQEQIEREHPGCTAMISIGCGADANPNPRTDDLAIVRQHGDEIAREVKRLLAAPQSLKPLSGNITAKREEFPLPLAELPTKQEFEKRTTLKGPIAPHAKAQLERLAAGKTLPTSVPYSVQTWLFGGSLAMVFLPGEVVVDYQKRLKRELDGRRLWINAYSNASPCYIASKRLLGEGGYEVDGSMYYYDQPQHFAPEVEDVLIKAVHRAFQRTPLPVVTEQFDAATRFLDDVKKIVARDEENPPAVGRCVLFIGSSTIVRWKLEKWFPDLPAVNHGFGGSYLSDSVFWFDTLVTQIMPQQIVLFAGSNDLAAGKTPEQVVESFRHFMMDVAFLRKLHDDRYQQRPDKRLRLYYLAITPSVKRWEQIETQRETNRLIAAEIDRLNKASIDKGDVAYLTFIPTEKALLGPDGQPQPKLYVADGLHLSDDGYAIITKLVADALKK